MTPEFLTAPLAQAIGWALLHLVWQGAIVATILAAALALLQQRSANIRYAFACAALALLPLLAAVTAWRCYEPLPAAIEQPMALHPDSLPTDLARVVVAHATRAAVLSAGDLARSALPDVVLIWLAGVTILSIRLFIGLARVQRLVAGAAPASLGWERVLRRLRHALGLQYGVALLESAAVEIPTVVGWLRPAVLLPASTLSGLSPDQIEMLLAHELAHIRRNDFFVNVLQSVVETLMFYHPAAWWISNRIRVERENCCDDLAVEVCGNAVQYARALTRLEELRSTRAGLAVAANGGSLVGRIRRLVGMPIDATASASRWLAGVGVLAIVAVVLSVPTLPAETQPVPAAPAARAATPARSAAAPRPAAAHSSIDVTPDSGVEGGVVGGVAGGVSGGIAGGIVAQTDDAIADADEAAAAADVAQLSSDAARAAAEAMAMPAPAPIVRVGPTFAIPVMTPRIAINVAPRAMAMAVSNAAISAPAIAEAVRDGVAGARPARPRHRREFGASGKLTVDELIELRNAGVTPEYITEMRGSGLGNLTLGDLAMLGIQGIHAAYIKDLRAAGIDVKTAEDAVSLHIHGVTAAYAQQMRAAGLGDLSPDDIAMLAIHGVQPSYIKELRAAGIEIKTAEDAAALQIQNVSPAFIQQMRDAGYTNLTRHDLFRLRAVGVTPALIKSLADAGYANLSVQDLIRLAARGVNPDFIREMSQYRDKK